mmetsp:Transcript_1624/g.3560  ORF Transcript_1624/g.3560 Transcript_1624/m.3560 type:complete len:257 (-) Transcript_1624:100-870(-)
MELVILLRHVDGELCSIHDERNLGQVSVVSLPDSKIELVPRRNARLHQRFRERGRSPSRNAHQIAVLGAPVPELIRAKAVFVEQFAVFHGEVLELARGYPHGNHLRVAQLSVISNVLRVVVTNLPAHGASLPPGVAGPRCQVVVRSAKDAALRLYEFVLDVPKAAASEVYIDDIIASARGEARADVRNDCGGGENGCRLTREEGTPRRRRSCHPGTRTMFVRSVALCGESRLRRPHTRGQHTTSACPCDSASNQEK